MSDNPLLREFLAVLRSHEGVDPDQLARTCIEALFDHLLNPPELDADPGPFEDEALSIKQKLIGLVNDEAVKVSEFIRRHKSPDA